MKPDSSRCSYCSYTLHGNPTIVCPECGMSQPRKMPVRDLVAAHIGFGAAVCLWLVPIGRVLVDVLTKSEGFDPAVAMSLLIGCVVSGLPIVACGAAYWICVVLFGLRTREGQKRVQTWGIIAAALSAVLLAAVMMVW